MHYTGMATAEKACDWLCRPESNVSCHYLVDEKGAVIQMVDEALRAWHAGEGTWFSADDINSLSIGRAFEMLSEHFDHVVIAVGTYDEDKQYTTTASYYGGVAPAIGLCKLYEKRWIKEHLWGPDDDEG